MNSVPDDVVNEINKFLCIGDIFNMSSTNKYNNDVITNFNPNVKKYKKSMDVINCFMIDHYHNALSHNVCPVCKRQNCCSAKCLIYYDDYIDSFTYYYY